MHYRRVIFDLDGTLLDTIEDLGAAVNYALGLREFPLHTMDEYRLMVGNGVRKLVQRALPAGPSDELVDACLADFLAYYQNHIDVHTRPYPGIPELLASLAASGVTLAVASNKFQEGAEHLIREFFPSIPFRAVLGNAPGQPLKPDPALVALAVGTDLSGTVFVGDSPTDIATARNAGIPCIAVSWGFRPREDLLGADAIADTVQQLRELL